MEEMKNLTRYRLALAKLNNSQKRMLFTLSKTILFILPFEIK